MSETSQIVTPTLHALARQGVWCWRNNSGIMPANYNGQKRFVRMAPTGSPDIIGVLPNGVMFGLEAKLPGKKQSPEQVEWQAKMEKNGAKYSVFFSRDEGVSIVMQWVLECQSSSNLQTAKNNSAPRVSSGVLRSTAASVHDVPLACAASGSGSVPAKSQRKRTRTVRENI